MELTSKLKQRLQLPAIAAPLFIISNPQLVIAQSLAGMIGSMPSLNARPIEQLDDWLAEICEALAHDYQARTDVLETPHPFAINLIVHKTNARLEQDLALVCKYKVPVVITSLGARPEINEAVHAYGGVVLHDIINNQFAHKAIDKGADGIVAVAAGAGGHAGQIHPFALIQEIRQWFTGPLALSGAIAHGGTVAAALAAGADFAYIGSPFIATDEARADEAYKQAIVDANSEDIVYTNLFTGVHGNYLRKSITNVGLDPENLPSNDPSAMNFANTSAKAWKEIWGCGQGVGIIKQTQPCADYVAGLKREYQQAIANLIADHG